MIRWNTDRRSFLKTAGALGAGLLATPRFAWAADGDTLRIRMDGDLQMLDPAFMIGGLDDVIMRGIYVSLNRLGDLRESREPENDLQRQAGGAHGPRGHYPLHLQPLLAA